MENSSNSNFANKIRLIHLEYCKLTDHPDEFFDLVWTHSVIVSEIALQLADALTAIAVDDDLLLHGALVHDIGMYVCYDDELNTSSLIPALEHGFAGARILKDQGLDHRLQRFCLTHIATGLTAEDVIRENLNADPKDYLPITVEEELVCYADKFHTKYPSFSDYDDIANRISKFDPSRRIRLGTLRRKYGLPELTDLVIKHQDWSDQINAKISSLS